MPVAYVKYITLKMVEICEPAPIRIYETARKATRTADPKETIMIDAAHTATTQQCWECAHATTLIAVVPGEDSNAAHHVFKCEHCGYFNWIDEAQPYPKRCAPSRHEFSVRSRAATLDHHWTPSGRYQWRLATKQRRKPIGKQIQQRSHTEATPAIAAEF